MRLNVALADDDGACGPKVRARASCVPECLLQRLDKSDEPVSARGANNAARAGRRHLCSIAADNVIGECHIGCCCQQGATAAPRQASARTCLLALRNGEIAEGTLIVASRDGNVWDAAATVTPMCGAADMTDGGDCHVGRRGCRIVDHKVLVDALVKTLDRTSLLERGSALARATVDRKSPAVPISPGRPV